MEIATGAAITVPRDLVTDIAKLKKELTIVDKGIEAATRAGQYDHLPQRMRPEPFLSEWYESHKTIRIPRACKSTAIAWGDAVHIDERPAHRYINIKSNLKPRPHQIPALRAIVGEDGRIKEGVLAMNVGLGKTAVALHVLSMIKTGPVLVVVPDGGLLAQWKQRIQDYGIEVCGGVGQMGDGVVDVANRGIVIGIIDTVVSDKIPQAVRDYFDTIIVDEAHEIATPTGRLLFWTYPGRRLCLSATWQRRDGKHKIIALHCGPVLYSDTSADLKIKTVFCVETGVVVKDPSTAIIQKPYLTPRDKAKIGFNWPVVMSNLANNEHRKDIVFGEIKKAVDAGRCCLVLGSRIALLKELHQRVRAIGKKASLIIGEVDMDERTSAVVGMDVVFGTDSLAKKGLDYPPFDTLFLLFPQHPKQPFGRIQRAYAGKKDPIVIVFEDIKNPSAAKQAIRFRQHVEAMQIPIVTINRSTAK